MIRERQPHSLECRNAPLPGDGTESISIGLGTLTAHRGGKLDVANDTIATKLPCCCRRNTGNAARTSRVNPTSSVWITSFHCCSVVCETVRLQMFAPAQTPACRSVRSGRLLTRSAFTPASLCKSRQTHSTSQWELNSLQSSSAGSGRDRYVSNKRWPRLCQRRQMARPMPHFRDHQRRTPLNRSHLSAL